jgi:iron complex outermembrane receptor protein
MRFQVFHAAVVAAAFPFAALAGPTETADTLDAVEVTATRVEAPVDRLPAQITVISGDELRARGATDLRTALSMISGVDAPPGGDAGNASAVPSLWGLHEFDAFLLVVDGVPLGGAYNPSIATLNLNDVERIEVLKGAAPVVYGATAFVGVVQVIHYAAGTASDDVQLGYGSYGSTYGSTAFALPTIDGYRQSFAASGERTQYKDPREGLNNGKFLYRGGAEVLGGQLRIDADATLQRQAPTSPVIRQGSDLVTPVDANFNPANARISENRYHFVLGYDHATVLGDWSTTASYSHSTIHDVRGFLRPDYNDPAAEPDAVGDNADYMNQDRGILDLYADTHLAKTVLPGLQLVYGADFLYGSGKQQSTNGAYCAGGTAAPYNCGADQAGSVPESTTDRPVDEINGTDDRRAFYGQYLQANWLPADRWTVLAGLRLNETHERKRSTHIDTADATADTDDYDTKNKTKLSGMVGSSYQVWHDGKDEAVAYADYRNQFKPAAIDFGPDVTPAVLNPETSRSYDGGIKGRVLDGHLDYDANLFFLHFNNLVVQTTDANGDPVMVNAGSSIFKGFELETKYHVYKDLSVGLNYSYHDARYVKYAADDGIGNYDGKNRALSPHVLASYGFYYGPRQGFNASFVAAYIGNRYLDEDNTASTPSYTTLDGSLGYKFRAFSLTLNGYNLTDERKPVTNSEFGDGSYYFLPARTVFINFGIDLRRI